MPWRMDAQERLITYRIALGLQQGRKVFTLQTIPPSNTESSLSTRVANTAGFSLHAGVAAEAYQRDKLERLCRYISRPAVALGDVFEDPFGCDKSTSWVVIGKNLLPTKWKKENYYDLEKQRWDYAKNQPCGSAINNIDGKTTWYICQECSTMIV